MSDNTEDKEKGSKAYRYGKSSIHEGSQQEMKTGTPFQKIINDISKSLSIHKYALNVNGLNYTIESLRVAEEIK